MDNICLKNLKVLALAFFMAFSLSSLFKDSKVSRFES